MARWLQLGYTCGQRTVIEGVRRLPPGHILEADGSEIKVTPWYDLASRVEASGPGPASAEEAAEALDPLLRDSVRIRLVSDVPLGCFLSGGVDSTAVVAAAVAEGTRPETVTVRFEGGADESPVARTTAAALGVDHRVEPCSAQEMASVVARWARLAGDPIADPSLAPTWVVSRAARLRWTVALSGDGGDELLGGYPRLRLAPRLDSLLRAPSSLRRLATPLLPKRRWGVKLAAAWQTASAWQAYQALQGVWPATRAAALVGVDCTALPWPHELVRRLEAYPTDQRYRLLDALTFLPERVLAKVDRASMDRSLEVRVPLLDHRVVELLLSLPGSVVKGKQPLRRVLARLGGPQPPRAKRGFEVPLAQWLRGPLRDTVEADLLGSGAADLGLDPKALRQAWDTHQSGAADLSERLLAVAVLVGWARELGLTR
jgi:asparagine synthase (glutamine-hydrolysing)